MNNVLTFPNRNAHRILKAPWMDGSDVALIQIDGTGLEHEGFLDGDRLVLNLRFQQSQIRPGELVVVNLPDGKTVVRRIFFGDDGQIILRSSNPRVKDRNFDSNQVRIDGIVMELSRSLALAS